MVNKKRPIFLNVWLILMIIFDIIALISIFITGEIFPSIFSIASLFFIIALYRWKIYGFFGILIVAVITLIINLFKVEIFSSIFGPIGVLILYLAMRPVWREFE